jgi:hypothetical protein
VIVLQNYCIGRFTFDNQAGFYLAECQMQDRIAAHFPDIYGQTKKEQ